MIKTELKAFSADLNKTLAELGKRHGLDLNFKTIRYTDTSLSFSVKGNIVDAKTGKVDNSLDAQLASDSLALHGIDVSVSDLMNTVFVIYGDKFRFVSFKRQAPKFPFIMQKVGTDSKYKMPHSSFYGLKGR